MAGSETTVSESATSSANPSPENGTSSSHAPDKPETIRTRILKRLEDSVLADTIAIDAIVADKIGEQNYRLQRHQDHLLEQAGVDLGKAKSGDDDMPWAGTSVGNEYHYHGVMPPGQQQPPSQPTTTPSATTPEKSLAAKLAPYAMLTSLLGIPAAGAVGYFMQSGATDTRETVDVTGGIPITDVLK